MTNVKLTVACAGLLAFLMTVPSLAKEGNSGNHYGWGNGQSHSAPGPELGVGISGLIAGGYLWYRRRSRKQK
jgi:hypothetical protein